MISNFTKLPKIKRLTVLFIEFELPFKDDVKKIGCFSKVMKSKKPQLLCQRLIKDQIRERKKESVPFIGGCERECADFCLGKFFKTNSVILKKVIIDKKELKAP